jgi:hypothetical protein
LSQIDAVHQYLTVLSAAKNWRRLKRRSVVGAAFGGGEELAAPEKTQCRQRSAAANRTSKLSILLNIF